MDNLVSLALMDNQLAFELNGLFDTSSVEQGAQYIILIFFYDVLGTLLYLYMMSILKYKVLVNPQTFKLQKLRALKNHKDLKVIHANLHLSCSSKTSLIIGCV